MTMKACKVLAGIGLAFMTVVSVQAQTVLLDFGNDSTFRGKSTSGNWNSLSGGAFSSNLIDTAGSATTIDFGPDGMGATDSFNAPGYSGQYSGWSGLTPAQQQAAIDQMALDADAAIDNAALGDLGEGTAAMDFYSSTGGRFQLQQVTPGQPYDLTFYSAKKFPVDDDSTTITVYDDSGYSNSLGSVTLFHGDATGAANTNQLATISNLIGPSNANNIFYVEFAGDSGGTGYINSMSLTVVPEPSTFTLIGLACAGLAFLRRRR